MIILVYSTSVDILAVDNSYAISKIINRRFLSSLVSEFQQCSYKTGKNMYLLRKPLLQLTNN